MRPPGMPRLLFVDVQTKAPYDRDALATKSIGGTEATTIRVAEALSDVYDVRVAQTAREPGSRGEGRATYLAYDDVLAKDETWTPDAVVLLRWYDEMPRLEQQYPAARRFLWAHDLRRIRHVRHHASALAAGGWTVVCVSKFLAVLAREKWSGFRWYHTLENLVRRPPPIKVTTVYNAIDEDLAPNGTPVDPTKMVFLSSPAKGLAQVIEDFAPVHAAFPEMRLHVATPGYVTLDGYGRFDNALLERPGIEVLGNLTHADVIRHVRESFCVFYPQRVKAETFGLIYAEANAVGTPVLAHDFGPAREILSNDAQVIDATKPGPILDTFRAWKTHGRPHVEARPAFRMSAVARAWRDLLELDDLEAL